MQHNQREQRLHWLMLVSASLGIAASVLDALNLTPGLAARLTPLLIGVLILYLLHQQGSLHLLRILARGAKRKLDRLDVDHQMLVRPSGAAHDPKHLSKPAPLYREIKWHGLIFRSQSEIKIAKELDHRGIAFAPGCKFRLTTGSSRQTREVDFLVYHDGQWGILEVDGPHHALSAQADNWRDDRFRDHGISVSRFAASECYRNPKGVVETFLGQLKASRVNGSHEPQDKRPALPGESDSFHEDSMDSGS